MPRSKRAVTAYAGTYSSPAGEGAGKGNGQGIHTFDMDPATGVLTPREIFKDDTNPAWLAFDPSRHYLYSANEVQDFGGSNSGSVSAFRIDRASGRLTYLNRVSSEGAGPAHCSVHPSGKYVFAANYFGGTVAVLPVGPGGELGAATDVKRHAGPIRGQAPKSAPPGSFALSGHDRPHAHMVQPDPSGRFVFAADLALDQILVWKFEAGKLVPNDPPFVELPPGDGPRHFAFHPNGRVFYSLQEEGSSVVTFDYDAAAGRLTARQTVSTLPEGFAGTNYTSEIAVSADGLFVYTANRLHDSVAIFSVQANGTLRLAGEEWTRGDYPRSFGIDPSGNFLYACNQRSDAIAAFRRDRRSGKLTFTGQYTPLGSPAVIVFLS